MARALKYGPLGICGDDRYRIIPEARVIEMLMLIGWAYETKSPGALEASKAALGRWTQGGLGFALATNGERLFDPVEVNNFLKRAGLDGQDGFWADRCVPTLRHLISDLSGASSSALSEYGERQFVIDFKRTFNLRSIAKGRKLRLRMPLPLKGNYLKDIQISPFAGAGQGAQIKVSLGRLEVQMVTSGEAEAILGATLSFSAFPQAPCPGPGHAEPDKALYLSHREGLIVVSERIRALARSVAGDGATTLVAVRAFWEYLNEKLIPGAVHYDQIDPASPCDWVLDSGWYDCQLAAALLAALCRARGIPARRVGGYQLYQMAPAKHDWAEVWLEDQGWTPFDFLSWDLSRGGRAPEWRDHFFGRLDYRMITERLPREFTGSIGIPIPQVWGLLHVPTEGGVEISFLNGSGTPVYVDTVRVVDRFKE
jgi:hypothetical protein